MNLYFWLIIAISVIILAAGAFIGGHRGLVKELEGLVAAVCATVALVLVGSLARGNMTENISTKALAIALLIILGLLYSVCRIVFASLRLFAGLPVIRYLDGILGMAAGVLKAYLILYVVFYLLKIWLNL